MGAWGSRKGRMGIVRRLSMITGWLPAGWDPGVWETGGQKQEATETVCRGRMGRDLARGDEADGDIGRVAYCQHQDKLLRNHENPFDHRGGSPGPFADPRLGAGPGHHPPSGRPLAGRDGTRRADGLCRCGRGPGGDGHVEEPAGARTGDPAGGTGQQWRRCAGGRTHPASCRAGRVGRRHAGAGHHAPGGRGCVRRLGSLAGRWPGHSRLRAGDRLAVAGR